MASSSAAPRLLRIFPTTFPFLDFRAATYPAQVCSSLKIGFSGIPLSAARTLFLASTSKVEWVDLLLFDLVIGGIEGTLTSPLEFLPSEPVEIELLNDVVELLKPLEKRFDSIFTGDAGRNPPFLSTSVWTWIDFKVLQLKDVKGTARAGFDK